MSQGLLYVEDDPVQALVVAELLAAREGLSLVIEESCAGALARVASWQPQLLLLDHELPDGSGPVLLAQLRELGVQAPALLLTAHRLIEAPEGFAAVLTKPLNFAAFGAAIDRLMQAASPAP